MTNDNEDRAGRPNGRRHDAVAVLAALGVSVADAIALLRARLAAPDEEPPPLLN